MNDNYSGQAAIYAGMQGPPAWLQNLNVGEWTTVASAGTIEAINPRNNPAINPNFPNIPEWWGSGLGMIVYAWCGGTYDYQRHNFWLPLSGGHADYAGNEPYAIDMSADNPAWRMVRPPSGAVGNLLTTNDAQESSGLYSDGRPRAIHSYNKCVFIPDYGPAVVPQGAVSWSGQDGTLRPVLIDRQTGEMSRFGQSIGIGFPNDYSGGGSCWDPTRRSVWVRNWGSGRFHRYLVDTDQWVTNQSNSMAVSGDTALVYMDDFDCILFVNQFLSTGFAVLDCKTGVIHQPTANGSWVGGMTKAMGLTQPHNIGNNRYAFWHNNTDRAVINVITPTGDPRTQPWTISQMPVAPTNSVVPTAATPNGTFGRFFHMPEYKCLGVYNDIAQPIYIYRYE